MKHHYSVVIQWSDADQAFLVTLPEFAPGPQTHGDTYKEAVKNAQEVLDPLIETYQAEGWSLPKAAKYRQPVLNNHSTAPVRKRDQPTSKNRRRKRKLST